MEERSVITAVIYSQNMNKVLILKRSNSVGTYQGAWACVSGYIEEGDSTPMERAIQEIKEETTLLPEDFETIKFAGVLEVKDGKRDILWHVHVFLALIRPDAMDSIRIDWEHREFRWVEPGDIKNMNTVPGLYNAVKMALSTL